MWSTQMRPLWPRADFFVPPHLSVVWGITKCTSVLRSRKLRQYFAVYRTVMSSASNTGRIWWRWNCVTLTLSLRTASRLKMLGFFTHDLLLLARRVCKNVMLHCSYSRREYHFGWEIYCPNQLNSFVKSKTQYSGYFHFHSVPVVHGFRVTLENERIKFSQPWFRRNIQTNSVTSLKVRTEEFVIALFPRKLPKVRLNTHWICRFDIGKGELGLLWFVN